VPVQTCNLAWSNPEGQLHEVAPIGPRQNSSTGAPSQPFSPRKPRQC